MTSTRQNESWVLELAKIQAIHSEIEAYFRRKGDLDAINKLREVFSTPRRCIYVCDVSEHVECELRILDESSLGDTITTVYRG